MKSCRAFCESKGQPTFAQQMYNSVRFVCDIEIGGGPIHFLKATNHKLSQKKRFGTFGLNLTDSASSAKLKMALSPTITVCASDWCPRFTVCGVIVVNLLLS